MHTPIDADALGASAPPERSVTVREVGPRDGLQSSAVALPVATRAQLVEDLAAAGLSRIECSSFVSERAVPQMAGAAELTRQARLAVASGVSVEALAVNAAGCRAAHDAGASLVVFVLSASETFCRKNTRMSREASLAQLREASWDVPLGRLVATVSTAFGCAYEGKVAPAEVIRIMERAAEIGVREFHLCDTVGSAAPRNVTALMLAVRDTFGEDLHIGLHFHDTRGLGLANVMAGLECGVRQFDSSFGGLGGCPFSPGSSGNVATEDLVHLLDLEGFECGVDLERLADVSRSVARRIGVTLPSHVLSAGPAWALGVPDTDGAGHE